MDYRQAVIVDARWLRRFIGFLGLSFPIILSLGWVVIFNLELRSSVSSYYHTPMRDYFVGCLLAIGTFFMAYRGDRAHGFDPVEDLMANLAGVAAVGVAFFPTLPESNIFSENMLIQGKLHNICAAVLFIILTWFCLFRFKRGVNNVYGVLYKAFGGVMLICVILLALQSFFQIFCGIISNPVFWGEYVALVSFGLAWLIKGIESDEIST